jgi:hypothetical protein
VFLNLHPIVNALGVLRITLFIYLKNLVSIIHSTQPLLLTFFCQEQGRRNDLLSKYDGPIPQDDRSLLSSSCLFNKYQK